MLVSDHEDQSSIWSFKSHHLYPIRLLPLCCEPYPGGASGQELAEMCDGIIHRLLVELIPISVHDDRSIHEIIRPVWTSIHVKSQIPISPASHPMVQGLYDIGHIELAPLPGP